MAKKRDVRGRRQAAIPFDSDQPHPGGLSSDEIAKVIADVEECFRRQSEFFSRMTQRGMRPHRHNRNSR